MLNMFLTCLEELHIISDQFKTDIFNAKGSIIVQMHFVKRADFTMAPPVDWQLTRIFNLF